MDAFYGMITNIDENLGRLRAHLDALGIADNTILIYMSDNGRPPARNVTLMPDNGPAITPACEARRVRSMKAGIAFLFSCTGLKATSMTGREVNQLAAHIDLAPTLIDVLELEQPAGAPMDGTSLRGAIEGDANALRDRTLFVHSQRIENPEKWRKSSVMTDRWRLVNQTELYDIHADPGQSSDVAEANPDVVQALQQAYDGWWESLSPVFDDYVRIALGDESENPTSLMSHDWHSNNGPVPWHQRHVQDGLVANGYWAVDVAEAGTYTIGLYRWPNHTDQAMGSSKARLKVGDVDEVIDLQPGDTEALFEVELEAGPTTLQSWLTNEAGEEHGAYFVEVVRE